VSPPFSTRSHDGMGRRVPRCPLAVPVRVTVVRSGIPNAIPGRSVDLSEGGIAAVLAGEVIAGDPVGVEFLLPDMGLGLHAKAIVRHQEQLRCGLEFQSLSVEQRAMIRRWTHRVLAIPVGSTSGRLGSVAPINKRVSQAARSRLRALTAKLPPLPDWKSRQFLAAIGAVAFLFLLFAWWNWQRGWQQLEAEVVPGRSAVGKTQRLVLAPGVMEPLLVSKFDPEVPPGARTTAGAVVVQVVIGEDGTIIDQHAMSGPESLLRAAMDAVRSWRFQPYRLKGKPVEVETTLTVEFQEK
jgi:TonB family protein